MKRRVRRLALIASSGAALAAISASAVDAAQQAAIATTLPATGVTMNSAVLNGKVDTGGQPAEWQFEYGTTTSYSHATPLTTTPPSSGTIPVSATITGLQPNTTYHFRLLAISGISSAYFEIDYGADLTFKTKPNGAVTLVSRTLGVSKGRVNVGLKCKSAVACSGRYVINTRATLATTHKVGTVLCATKAFTIPANATRHPKSKVRGACLALLRHASGHKIKGTLSASTTTGQSGPTKSVTLILK